MKLERVKAAEDTRIAPNADHPMTWTEYHSTDDINAYLDYLQATYPDLVSGLYWKCSMWCIKIGSQTMAIALTYIDSSRAVSVSTVVKLSPNK